jgi:hypothetical protein
VNIKRAAIIVLAIAAGGLLAGCSGASTLPTSSTNTPTTTQSSTSSATPSATSSATSTTSSAAPIQTDSIEIVTEDGFKAHVTVAWSAETTIDSTESLPVCAEAQQAPAGSNYAYHVITATLSADFPVVAGFAWPSTDRITVDASGGSTFTCFDPDEGAGAYAHITPANPILTAMWLVSVEKTPNNPTGLLTILDTSFGLRVAVPASTCTSTAAQVAGRGAVYTSCTSSYPSGH